MGSWTCVEQWELGHGHQEFEHHAFWCRQENVCRYYTGTKLYASVLITLKSKIQKTYHIREERMSHIAWVQKLDASLHQRIKKSKTCHRRILALQRVQTSNQCSLFFMEVCLLWPMLGSQFFTTDLIFCLKLKHWLMQIPLCWFLLLWHRPCSLSQWTLQVLCNISSGSWHQRKSRVSIPK